MGVWTISTTLHFIKERPNLFGRASDDSLLLEDCFGPRDKPPPCCCECLQQLQFGLRPCDPSEEACKDPFDHSEGQFSPNVKKSEKSLEVGSRGLLAPGGKKSQKRFKNELKSLKNVSFELIFNSFLTFLPPGAGRPREPISRLFSDFFTFGLNCPSEWSKGSQVQEASKDTFLAALQRKPRECPSLVEKSPGYRPSRGMARLVTQERLGVCT